MTIVNRDELFSGDGITYNDFNIMPGYIDFPASDVDLSVKLSDSLKLNLPLISSPMDTVTEEETAIALALLGGIGIIHYNNTIEEQVKIVKKVKKYIKGILFNPITLTPDDTVEDVLKIKSKHGFSGIPIVQNKKLIGIITSRDIDFIDNKNIKISEIMTPIDKLTTYVIDNQESIKDEKDKIFNKLKNSKLKKLPIIDKENNLVGLVTRTDLKKLENYPNANKDKLGRLIVGAAISTHDSDKERLDKLIKAGVDVIVIDAAQGYSKWQINLIKYIKERYDITIIAGNVVTPEGARALINAGADPLRIGMGSGCLVGDSLVLMGNGTLKKIEDIEPGKDEIVNYDGKKHKVKNKIITGYRQEFIRFKSELSIDGYTFATPEHRIMVYDNEPTERLATTYNKHIKWVAAKDLTTDMYLCTPVNIRFTFTDLRRVEVNDKIVQFDEDFGKLAILIVNSKMINYNGGVIIKSDDRKTIIKIDRLFRRLLEIEGKFLDDYRLHFGNKKVVQFIKKFKDYKLNKFPHEFFKRDIHFANGVLSYPYEKITNPHIKQLWWNYYKHFYLNQPRKVLLLGRITKIYKIKKNKPVPVYDLECGGSFVVNNHIVHNSICTTQETMACGRAQASAVYDIWREFPNIPLIADGGINSTGDIVKAIASGASACMMGRMFAGTTESPGEYIYQNGIRVKRYRGMASLEAMKDGGDKRYFSHDLKIKVAQGISGTVVDKGSLYNLVPYIEQSLKLAFQDIGAKSIAELHEPSILFEKKSQSAQIEGNVHNLHTYNDPTLT